MKLHLGASRHQLAAPNTSALRTADWVHLGAPEPLEDRAEGERENDGQSGYVSFYFTEGVSLPFPENHFSFAFSEHFFEHLFLNGAGELFRECWRVLQPGACFRIVVPDADLRTYQDPEPAGYTTGDPGWHHPDKHKTRWSIYSLPYVLEQIGFVTRGVVFCDRFGNYVKQLPDDHEPFYKDCLDQAMVLRTDYIMRLENSLIVDAVKPLA